MRQNVILPKISVLVFCFNDEDNLKNLIANISFAHEIIIIDNHSTDKTNAIAKEHGLNVILQTTEDKRQQQHLIETQNDWILLLDKDEYLSEELKDEIFIKISSSNANEVYYIKQSLFFFKKRIKHGEFKYRKKIFIYDKKRYSFLNDIGDKPLNTQFKKSNVFKNRIDFYAYKGFDEYNYQISIKNKKEAQVLHQKKVSPNIYHFLIKPFLNFVNEYFIKLGFLDGKEGYILAYINAFAVLKRYLILWLLYNNME
jgi:glycosyltransferase involved in cell wall biosynthesis